MAQAVAAIPPPRRIPGPTLTPGTGRRWHIEVHESANGRIRIDEQDPVVQHVRDRCRVVGLEHGATPRQPVALERRPVRAGLESVAGTARQISSALERLERRHVDRIHGDERLRGRAIDWLS